MRRPDPVEIVAIVFPIIAEAIAVSVALCAAFVWLAVFSDVLP